MKLALVDCPTTPSAVHLRYRVQAGPMDKVRVDPPCSVYGLTR